MRLAAALTVLLLSLKGEAWAPVPVSHQRPRFAPVVTMVSPDGDFGMDPSINAYSNFMAGPESSESNASQEEVTRRKLLEARLAMEQKQKNLANGVSTSIPTPAAEAVSEATPNLGNTVAFAVPARAKPTLPAAPKEGTMRKLLEARLAMEQRERQEEVMNLANGVTASTAIPSPPTEKMEVVSETKKVPKEEATTATTTAVTFAPPARVKPIVPGAPDEAKMRKLLQARLMMEQQTKKRRTTAPVVVSTSTPTQEMEVAAVPKAKVTTFAVSYPKPMQPTAPEEGSMRKLLEARLSMEQKEREKAKNQQAMSELYEPPKMIEKPAPAVSTPPPGPFLEAEQVVTESISETPNEPEAEQELVVVESPPAMEEAETDLLVAESTPVTVEEVVESEPPEPVVAEAVTAPAASPLLDDIAETDVPDVVEPAQVAVDEAVEVDIPTLVEPKMTIEDPTTPVAAAMQAEEPVAMKSDETQVAAKLPKIDIPPEAVEQAAELAQKAIVAIFKGCAFVAKEGFQLAVQAKDSLKDATVEDMDISYEEAFQKMSTGVKGFVKICAVLGGGIKDVVVSVAKEAKAANERRMEQQRLEQQQQKQIQAAPPTVDLDQLSTATEAPSIDTSIDGGLEDLKSKVDSLMASASSAFEEAKAKVPLKDLQSSIDEFQLNTIRPSEGPKATANKSSPPTSKTEDDSAEDKTPLFFLNVKD